MKKPATYERTLYTPTRSARALIAVGAVLVGLLFVYSDAVTLPSLNIGNLFFTFALWSVTGYVIFYALAALVQRSRTKTEVIVVQKKRMRQ